MKRGLNIRSLPLYVPRTRSRTIRCQKRLWISQEKNCRNYRTQTRPSRRHEQLQKVHLSHSFEKVACCINGGNHTLLGTWEEIKECPYLSYHVSVDKEYCSWPTRYPCRGIWARRKPQHVWHNGFTGPLCIKTLQSSAGDVQNVRSTESSGLL